MKRIDLLCSTRRPDTTNKTIKFWEDAGWQVQCWYNDGNSCGEGRNHMLDDFYASDRQWIVMADDDITLYTHRYLTAKWLDNVELWQQQDDVDYFSLNSNNETHRQMMKSWWDTAEFNQQFVYKRDFTPTKIHIFRKPPKKLYFEKWYGYEDYDFAFQFLQQGLRVARLLNVFLREQGFDKSSLFKDHQHRKECYAEAKKHLVAKWGTNYTQCAEQYWQAKGAWHLHPQYGWICCESSFNQHFTELFECH